MPHLELHAREEDLAGREADLIDALTTAVVDVYGDWARSIVDVRLTGIPAGRWAIGGRAVETPTVAISFGVRQALFERPDADQLVRRLVAVLTDAVTSAFGDAARSGVTVDLVAVPPGRTSVGGALVD